MDFARRAVELGLAELGFADHNPMPKPFDDWRMAREDLPRYLEEIDKARVAFPQLPIRVGLECDFLIGSEKWIEELRTLAPWDYLIGSVHYLPEGWEVDHPKYISRYRDGNVEEIWTKYWNTYEKCIRSRLFDFVAHPDLPKKFGFVPEGDLRRFYEPVIAALAETDTPFEINTAGWRKECQEQYPARQFLEMAAEAGIPLLINSDAHAVAELAAGFIEAAILARQCGFRNLVRYEGGKRRQVLLP